MSAAKSALIYTFIFWAQISLAGPALEDFRKLTPEQQAEVLAGKAVTFTEPVEDSPWPRIILFQKIQCSPEEASAVTMDYPLKTVYGADQFKTGVVEKQVDSTTTDVAYEVKVPFPIPNEHMTVRNKVERYEDGSGFKFIMTLLRGKATKKMEGVTRYEKLDGDAGTLVMVDTLTVPDSGLAGLFKGKILKDTVRSIQAFAGFVEREVKERPDDLKKRVNALRQALGAR